MTEIDYGRWESELYFVTADELRDVAARLEAVNRCAPPAANRSWRVALRAPKEIVDAVRDARRDAGLDPFLHDTYEPDRVIA